MWNGGLAGSPARIMVATISPYLSAKQETDGHERKKDASVHLVPRFAKTKKQRDEVLVL